jgi:hypothetical protein
LSPAAREAWVFLYAAPSQWRVLIADSVRDDILAVTHGDPAAVIHIIYLQVGRQIDDLHIFIYTFEGRKS